MKYLFDVPGDRQAVFRAAGKRRCKLEQGFVLVNGIVRLADGTEYPAVLEIDEGSLGELWGTYILLPTGTIEQPDWERELGKSKKEIYPFRYKVTAKLHCKDAHVGKDGWSE